MEIQTLSLPIPSQARVSASYGSEFEEFLHLFWCLFALKPLSQCLSWQQEAALERLWRYREGWGRSLGLAPCALGQVWGEPHGDGGQGRLRCAWLHSPALLD